MKRNVCFRLAAAFWLAAALILSVSAQTPQKSYAQKLVDDTLAKHPEVATLALHVTPPNSSENEIMASNFGRIGKKADADDLQVIKTGTPKMEVNKTGDRFSVELPLQDVGGNTVGALAVVFPYKAGDDKAKFQKQAEQIRDHLRKRISHTANLFDPGAELLFGAARRQGAVPLKTAIEEFLLRVDALPWDSKAARHYAELRATLERHGAPMGSLDMMIAAHALAAEAVLVTNDSVFRRVKQLKIEDWSMI